MISNHIEPENIDQPLAIYGGRPAVVGSMPHFVWPPPIEGLGDVIAEYVNEGRPLSIADRSGIYEELEDELCRLHGRRYALLTSSGTAALHSAFFALGLEQGDEVISTVYSFHATASPLLHLGVRIRFCDVESDTGNIDINALKNAIGPATRAIVTNHQWGHPVDCQAVSHLAMEHGIPWIEDCSHAHFAEFEGRRVGTFGAVSVFSLQGNKLLTGGEGGVLLTDSREVYEKAILFGHWLGRSKSCVTDLHWAPLDRTGLGLKFRMHPLAAVMVMHLLKHHALNWVASRERTLSYFEKQLVATGLLEPMARRSYVTSMGAHYGFKPRINNQQAIKRDALVKALQAENVDITLPGSEPFHQLALFDPGRFKINKFEKAPIDKNGFPGADAYVSSIVSLPTFTFDSDRPLIDAYVGAFAKIVRYAKELV